MEASKEQILAEIRRAAQDNGGHVGLRAFLAATGMSEWQLLGKHWPTWNAALREAGLATKEFLRPRTDVDQVVNSVAILIERLGKWPTQNEIRLLDSSDIAAFKRRKYQ